MQELITFKHEELGEIKGFNKNGEPWFSATHVCKILGIKNTSSAVEQVKQRLKVGGVTGIVSNYITIDTKYGKQKLIVINEQVLYELMFRSRKQKAIKFTTWVTGEVLPSIRKTGIYRAEGKEIRLSFTDSIKKSVEDKSDNAKKFAYSNYSKLVNKSLGLDSKVNRDALDAETLEKIAHRENLVSALVNEQKEYQEIKAFIAGLS